MSPQSLLRKLQRRLARPQLSALVLADPEDDAEAVVRSVTGLASRGPAGGQG